MFCYSISELVIANAFCASVQCSTIEYNGCVFLVFFMSNQIKYVYVFLVYYIFVAVI